MMKLPPLDAPLLPLILDVPQAGPPGALPARPATLPGHSPFGPTSASQQWTTTTYAYPAGYPRTLPRSTSSAKDSDVPAKPASPSNDARLSKEEIERVRNAYLERRIEAMWKPTTSTSEAKGPNTLWCTANKYTPSNRPRISQRGEEPVTVILAHANGFSKETWEPMLDTLVKRPQEGSFPPIEEIWSLDMINQGDAAHLNREQLGDMFEWSDNGRDILQFILNYLPELDAPPPKKTDSSRKTISQAGSKPSAVKTGVKGWTTEDSSLSHWGPQQHASEASAAPEAKKARAKKSKSADPAADAKFAPAVQGWITEVDGMAARPRAGATSSSSSSTYVPEVLRRQNLPRNMSDANQLDSSSSSSLSTTLPPQKWRGRNIVLIGHSVGAAGMIYASSTFPHLFRSLTLVDPTVFAPGTPRWSGSSVLVTSALTRRDAWQSRKAAYESFKKNKGFYGKWDEGVLQRFVEFNLMPAPRDGEAERVALTMDKMQEMYVYADVGCYGSIRAFCRLPRIPRSVGVSIIRADVGQSTIPEDWYQPFIDTVKHAGHSRIKGVGHLIAQEMPKELANEIVRLSSRNETKAKL